MMNRQNWWIGLLMVCMLWTIPLQAQDTLSSQIGQLMKVLPAGSEVGISVYDLSEEKYLYDYRADKLSRPASTMKLVTAITAMSFPEGQAPFVTEVWTNGTIANDTLRGDVFVVGGFDPELSDSAMNALVGQIMADSIHYIDGRLYGDVSMKDSLYWGNGWAWDDNPAGFQPYMSPLMFHKGKVKVTFSPGEQPGDSVLMVCEPVSSYYDIVNRTRTKRPEEGKLCLTRDWMNGSNLLLASGSVDFKRSKEVNLADSPAFFLHTFQERLQQQGISVSSGYGLGEWVPDTLSHRLATWTTPFQDVLDEMMQESDNLNAEAIFCRMGAQASGQKHLSADVSVDEIYKFMESLGYNSKHYKVVDGCGLSSYNYLSPELLVAYLRYAYSHDSVFIPLYKSLPIAGVNGTLEHRMRRGRAYRNVHAKTGSFTAINCLAGYIKTLSGHELAFAIMNQNILSSAQARLFQDKVCEILCGL